MVSDFRRDLNSGAAGTVETTANQLQKLGFECDLIWKNESPSRFPQPLKQILQLPFVQLRQVKQAFAQKSYDAVVISQPLCGLTMKWLKRHHPKTLRINRSHGWEQRGRDIQKPVLPPRTFKGSVQDRLFDLHCQATIRHCDAAVMASPSCRDYVARRNPAHAEKIVYISHGLDSTIARPQSMASQKPRVQLIYAGQYLRRKGSDALEKILPELRQRFEFDLTFVVQSDSRAKIEEVYRPVFQDSLRIENWCPREQLHRLLQEHDVFLFPSYFEGFPKAPGEAMMQGLIVCGFRDGGLCDPAFDEASSGMAAVGDLDGFRNRLSALLEQPHLMPDLKSTSRRCAEQFTWERTGTLWAQLLRGLAAGK